jgi:hypothetical protein
MKVPRFGHKMPWNSSLGSGLRQLQVYVTVMARPHEMSCSFLIIVKWCRSVFLTVMMSGSNEAIHVNRRTSVLPGVEQHHKNTVSISSFLLSDMLSTRKAKWNPFLFFYHCS